MRGNVRRMVVPAIVAAAVVGASAGPAAAAPGDLDSTFGGGDGRVTTSLGTQGAFGNAMAVVGNGRIVVAGEVSHSTDDQAFGVARYKPNGTLDPKFGNGGKVVTNLTGEFDSPYAVAKGPNGTILVGGYAGTNFAVVRYLPNGHLDHSFSGDGKAIVPFAAGDSFGYDMVVAKGGKVVMAGQVDNASHVSRFGVARLMPDGTLDHTFSGDGRATLDLGPNSYAYAVLALADGSIVAAGDGYVGATTSAAIVKYRPNGTLDEDFGEGGSFVNDVGVDFSPSGIVRTSDGKFLLVGSYRTGPATFEVGLMKFRANGKPDVTYGPDGLVTHDFGGDSDYSTKIVRVGTKVAVAVGHDAGTENQLGVVQFLANGGVDNSFGDAGLAVVPTGDQSSAGAIAVQSDGKLVAAGNTGSSDADAKFLVARFLES